MRKDHLDPRLIEELITAIFPRARELVVERVEEGVSTYVYRIHQGAEVFYLRVLPEKDRSFAPEVLVHTLLRERGVKVPEVVYFEHYNQALQHAVMVTTEIRGRHIGYCYEERELRHMLIEAGRDLAVINSIPVKGFGWIKRDSGEVRQLEAEWPTDRAFVLEHLDDDLTLLHQHGMADREIGAIREIIDCFDGLLDNEQAWLAHGDFDATHIYQEHGKYTGIIDFGEIRGTDTFYDLGHFRMHDGETLHNLVLPYLLEGYREVASLPSDYEQQVCVSSLLIGVRSLARSLRKGTRHLRDLHGFGSILRDISEFI